MSESPFEILGLPPTASEEEVVRQAARLCQRAGDEAARARYREAARRLTGEAGERGLHALLTHPGADHASPELERFVNAHRRPPAGAAAPAACPPLNRDEVQALLRAAVLAELAPAPLPLALVEAGEPAEEIARQSGEALWQGFVAEPRG
jgi:hypothetical protein